MGMLNWFKLIALILSSVLISKGKKVTSSLTLLDEPNDLLFLNTMPATLECIVTGYPTPKIVWVDNKDLPIQPKEGLISIVDEKLVFNAFLPSQYDANIHNTKYRCKASSDIGTVVSRYIKVKAVLDSRYSPIVYHQSAPIGGSGIFKCHLPENEKDYIEVLAWKVIYPGGAKTRTILSGMSIDGFNALTTGQMVVSDVIQIHEQYKFSCISRNILNNVTLTSSPGRLFPNVPEAFIPRNLVHPQDQTIYAGVTLTLNCDASAYPLPSFTWYKDGIRLRRNDRVKTITGGSIKIMRSTTRDQGKYSCVIEYKDEEKITLRANVMIKVPLALIDAPKLISTTSGKTVTFYCKARGSKPHNIVWYKDGMILQNNDHIALSSDTDSLLINDVTLNDKGIYQCVINNNFEQIQASARMIVDGIIPSVLSLTPSATVKAGDVVSISCTSSGEPLPYIKWFADNMAITDSNKELSFDERIGINNAKTSTINIRNIQTKYSSIFKCVAENRVGKDSFETSIQVTGPPSIVNFPAKRFGVTGRSLFLDCNGKGYPKVVHVWYKNGIQVQPTDNIKIFSNGTVQIKRFGVQDIAKYWCTIDNANGRTQKMVDVTLLDPPQIAPFRLDPVLVGHRGLYLCTLQDGSENGIDMKWYKNGLEVKEIEGIKISDISFSKVLTLLKVSTTHRGRYTCVVKNAAGEARYSADLIVYEKPVFKTTPVDTTVEDGHPVNLFCSATGFPLPQITWFRKGVNGQLTPVVLDHRIKQIGNGTLVIGVARASDNGRYVCQASFFDKKYVPDPISKEITILVKVPAKIISTSSLVARNIKSRSVELFCSSTGTLELTLKWFKNGVIISEDSNTKYTIYRSLRRQLKPPMLNSSIQIKNLERADNGEYECLVENSYGKNKVNFQVLVEEKPFKPNVVEEFTSTSTSMKIKWKPGYDGNSPITFYRVEMRETLKSWDSGKFFTINGNLTVFEITKLHPGSSYTFRVNARNRHGISDWSLESILKTKEEAPSAPPTNVSLQAIAKDRIFVEWREPKESKRNGIIIGFRITYVPNFKDSLIRNITTGFQRQYLLQDLLQYTSYRVQIQALTKAGGGPLSVARITTTLEGVPTKPPPSLDAQMINSEIIVVSWKPVLNEYINGVLVGYKVIYTDVGKQKTSQLTVLNALQIQLTNLRKFAMYRIAVLAFTKAGDGVMSDYIFKRTDEDIPDEPSGFAAAPASPTEILVTWSKPFNQNGILLQFTLYYTVKGDSSVNRVDNIKTEEHRYTLQGLRLGESYTIWMTARTIKGEGKETKKSTVVTSSNVPARIITPSLPIKSALGSTVNLPCVAVGYPKPSIAWFKLSTLMRQKRKRWLAADTPKKIYNIQPKDAGWYNCTAVNDYGKDWNVVELIVQVPPSSPNDISASLAGKKDINVTWVPGFNGNSPITQHHVNFIHKGDPLTWRKIIVPAEIRHYVITNVTSSLVYFRVASENEIGIGEFNQPVKLVISDHFVDMFPETQLFTIKKKIEEKDEGIIAVIMKPLLIAMVAFVTLIILLLFIASWDRDERRIRKPKCNRLVFCKCDNKRDFNDDPYGEPSLPWPWNVKSNRHSGAFDVHNELLASSDEQLEFQYAPNYHGLEGSTTNSLRKKFSNANGFDFEPVVLFTPKSPHALQSKNNNSKPPSYDNSLNRNEVFDGNVNQPAYGQTDRLPSHCDKPSIIEKYLRSQEELGNNYYPNKNFEDFNPRESILSEDSIDLPPPPPPPPDVRYSRGSADGKSTGEDIPTENKDSDKINSFISDVPRALLRGNSPKRNRRNRKSLDSLILKALEDIEEKQVLSNDAITNKTALEQHAANVIKELLAQPPSTYDSVSSTCSSSVGELRRAFEFGKKYGLQNYEIPDFISDAEEEDGELDYQAHERLLNAIDVANFSEIPRDSNDMQVKIPLPVRLGNEIQAKNDEALSSDDENDIGSGYDRGEQSLV